MNLVALHLLTFLCIYVCIFALHHVTLRLLMNLVTLGNSNLQCRHQTS